MIIYKTTNKLNGKIYIGQLTLINKKDYLGSGVHLKNAVEKYGKENFTREVICECLTQEELNEKEKYWIAHFNATNPDIGYNICDGGRGASGFKHSEETRSIIGESNRKRPPITEETRQKMIASSRKGQKLSRAHKAKIAKAHIGLKATPEQREKQSKAKQKPIIEYDLQMNIIKEWPSAVIASQELEIPRTNIGRVLKEQQKSVQNKIFRYKQV